MKQQNDHPVDNPLFDRMKLRFFLRDNCTIAQIMLKEAMKKEQEKKMAASL